MLYVFIWKHIDFGAFAPTVYTTTMNWRTMENAWIWKRWKLDCLENAVSVLVYKTSKPDIFQNYRLWHIFKWQRLYSWWPCTKDIAFSSGIDRQKRTYRFSVNTASYFSQGEHKTYSCKYTPRRERKQARRWINYVSDTVFF